MFKSCSPTKSTAKVVEGNLIISLPGAIDPVVWRMALGEARAAAIEIKPKQENFMLALKYPNGDSHEIAVFQDKQAAGQALMAISHAMQQAHGQIYKCNTTSAHADNSSATFRWKWLIPLGLILMALLVFSLSGTMLPTSYSEESNTLQSNTANNAIEDGIPLSADSFLNGM